MIKAKNKFKKIEKSPLFMAMVIGVIICAVLTLSWMIFREIYISQTSHILENDRNIVVNVVKAPSSLVSTLLAEDGRCTDNVSAPTVKNNPSKNVFYIEREVSGVALVQYGCGLGAHIFYKKENGKWIGISPTNQFIYGIPLCSHVKKFRIPSSVQAVCYENPTKEGHLPPLVANPVK